MDPAARFANRMLERESWARQRLAAHAGRSFVMVSGPVVAALCVDDTGLLQGYALARGPPDLRLAVQPWSVPGLLADPSRWDEVVSAEGDPALAATMRELAQTTPFWIEQFFGRWLGPVVGQRVAGAGRTILAFPDHAMERLAESVASYVRDGTGTLAAGEEARIFAEQVALIASRTDALEARLATLEAARPPH